MFRLKVVGFKRINRLTQRGFNLVEIAIALVILALALGGVISAFAPQLSNRGFTTTQAQLVEINESILAFAATNGRLPCPATPNSNGFESFCTTATGVCALVAPPATPAAIATSRGRCSATPGQSFVPAVTLGLSGQGSRGTVADAWAGTIQYVVTAVLNTSTNATPTSLILPAITPPCAVAGAANCFPLTQINGIKNAYYNQTPTLTLTSPPSDTFVCASATTITPLNCGPVINFRAQPAFVVFSLGSIRTRIPASVDEVANTNADRVFVSHDRTDPTAAVPFDDLFTWTTIDQLRARMVATKVVP